MNELVAPSSRIFEPRRGLHVEALCTIEELAGAEWKTCKLSPVCAARCLFMCECVRTGVSVFFMLSNFTWASCCNLFRHKERYELASTFEPTIKHYDLTLMQCTCYYFMIHISTHARTHIHTHICTILHCATWPMVSILLRKQLRAVLKIDLASEAESVYSHCSQCVLWSRPLSFILLKICTVLDGFRDTVSDLHLAEHKWVKRKYNTVQSPLLTPPGAYRLSQSTPTLFIPRKVLSMSPLCLPVCSNGVGHQALLKIGKKKRETYWFKNVLFCYFQSFHLYFFFF